MSNNYQSFSRDKVTITGTVSNKITCLAAPATLVIPATFTSADLTYQMSVDNGVTWNGLKDINGSLIKTTAAAAGDAIALDPAIFQGVQLLQITASVSQSTPQDLTLIYTPVLEKYSS